MTCYDEDSHGRVRYNHDFLDENEDLLPDNTQEERQFGFSLATYARLVADTNDALPTHGASCLNVLARKEGSGAHAPTSPGSSQLGTH